MAKVATRTLCRGPSALFRSGSPFGEPIQNFPPGSAIISGSKGWRGGIAVGVRMVLAETTAGCETAGAAVGVASVAGGDADAIATRANAASTDCPVRNPWVCTGAL